MPTAAEIRERRGRAAPPRGSQEGPQQRPFGKERRDDKRVDRQRAEQVINGAIRIVAIRSRLFSMVRVARIAGTAHA